MVEHHYFRDLNYRTLHYLYITRGIASSLMIGLWATWYVLRERSRHEDHLERSHRHYRSILDHTPDAVIVFDENFRVVEWNEAAERLYELAREQALGQALPTVPPERWSEVEELLSRVEENNAILDYETERRTVQGERIPVAVSYSRMLPFGDWPKLFLEVGPEANGDVTFSCKSVLNVTRQKCARIGEGPLSGTGLLTTKRG